MQPNSSPHKANSQAWLEFGTAVQAFYKKPSPTSGEFIIFTSTATEGVIESPTFTHKPTDLESNATLTPSLTPTVEVIKTEVTPTEEIGGGRTPVATATELRERTPDATQITESPDPGLTPKPSQEPTGLPTIRATVLPSATLSLTPSPTPSPTGATLPDPIAITGAHVSNEVIFGLKKNTDQATLNEIFEQARATDAIAIPELRSWIIKVPEDFLPYALAILLKHPAVDYAEPNYLAHAFAVPNDPGWEEQPYLQEINLPRAWDVTTGSARAIVAIVDTGIDAGHPDLAAKILYNSAESGRDSNGGDKRSNGVDDDGNGYVDDWAGWNALTNGGDVADRSGHGTHVSGIAAAGTNNATGIAGVAWDSPLLAVKALGDDGQGGYAQISMGILYAVKRGARVVNLSLGGTSYSRLLDKAVGYANRAGVVLVAAAGDGGTTALYYPAALDPVISVGASVGARGVAAFSSFGDKVDLFAPGKDIYATFPGGGYRKLSGTSMAAAQVSGVAALLASLPRYGGPAAAKSALLSSAIELGDANSGPRLVQAYQAVIMVAGEQIPAPATTPSPTISPTPILSVPIGKALPLYPLLPTAILPPPNPTGTPWPSDPHAHYNATTDSCAGCHRGHTAFGLRLRSTWPEEEVCFTCHTAGGSGTNVEPAFTSYPNTGTGYFTHPVQASNGSHSPYESGGSAFGGAARHIECEDCHEPHDTARGDTSAPQTPYEMNRVAGVDPVWGQPGSIPAYVFLAVAEREFQVCFKCHSSYTTLPVYAPTGWNGTSFVSGGLAKLNNASGVQVPDSRDLAIEFNPNSASFHPVVAQGRNQEIPAGSFVNGWSVASIVYCSDCHTNANAASQGTGPHGSPLLHMLDGSSNYTTVDQNNALASGELCFKCHDYGTYAGDGAAANTFFRDGSDNLHKLHSMEERAPCYVCHDTHGSDQLHLINFDTSVVNISGANRDSQNAWELNGNTRTCFLSCHGEGHNTEKSYTP